MIPRTLPQRSGLWNWYRLRCALGRCPLVARYLAGQTWLECSRCRELRWRMDG